jgi:hypothetical protein
MAVIQQNFIYEVPVGWLWPMDCGLPVPAMRATKVPDFMKHTVLCGQEEFLEMRV